MFKARKTRLNFSQRSSQKSSNEENSTQNSNIPLGQQPQVQQKDTEGDLFDDTESSFVAPSQEPSQTIQQIRTQRSQMRRFQSQRSNQRYATLSQQSRSIEIAKSYLESLLMKAGCNVKEESYILDCDVYAFQNRFDDLIRIADNYPVNAEVIIADVKSLMAKSEIEWRKLMKTVLYTLYTDQEDADSTEIHESQDNTMMRILLLNNHLQKDILEILFSEMKARSKPKTEAVTLDFALLVGQLVYVNFDRNHAGYISEQFFDILSECNNMTRDDMIRAIDDLITPTRHSDTVNQILTMITTPDELFTHKNLETFSNLCLNTTTMKKLRIKIFNYLEDNAPKDLYISMLNFLIRFNEDEISTFYEVITEIRMKVNWKVSDLKIQDDLFVFVKRSILRCQVTRDSWLQAIHNVNHVKDHRIVDVFALLVIACSNENKVGAIENIFKKKSRTKVFTVEFIQDAIRSLSGILTEYVKMLTDILEVCFREKDPYTVFFASTAFRMMFKIKHGDRGYIVSRLVAIACSRPSDIPFLTDTDIRTNALQLLLEIKKKLDTESRGAFYQVDIILDFSHNLTLDQYRIVMKILCSLAYDGHGDDGLQEDINIRARKNITDMHVSTKMQGIIAINQIMDKKIWALKNEVDTPLSELTIDSIHQIPAGRGRETADLLKTAFKSSKSYLDVLMLYYDELALIFSPRNKDMNYRVEDTMFNEWLSERILMAIYNTFIVDSCPESVRGVEMEYFFNINVPESDSENQQVYEGATLIGLNFGTITLFRNEKAEPKKMLNIIYSLFNALTNIIYRRDDTSLAKIDALLGCAIVLPKTFLDEDKLMQEHERLAFDLYFSTANWFRSVISAFSSQKSPILRPKVLKRINQLIELEASIKYMLLKSPNYEPPPSSYQVAEEVKFIKPRNKKYVNVGEIFDDDFDAELERPKQRGAKRKRNNGPETNVVQEFDEESMNMNATTGNIPVVTQFNLSQGTQAPEVVKHHAKYWFSYGPKEKYRQLDLDIMLLLEETLEIKFPVPENEIGKCLYLQELKFILTDLISKTESLAGVKKFRTEQQLQNLVSPTDYINDLVMSLKRIMEIFNQLTQYLQSKIDRADEEALSLYTGEANHTKICVGTCLHLFSALFSWPGFTIVDNYELLRAALYTILEEVYEEPNDDVTEVELRLLIEQAANKVVTYQTTVLDLRSAIHLLHLTKALASLAENPDIATDLAKVLLGRKWIGLEGRIEQGKNANLLLQELLKCYLRDMDFPKLEEVVETFCLEMVELKTKNDQMPSYPNFDRANCVIFYRCLLSACEQTMKGNVAMGLRTQDLINCWKQCFLILRILLTANVQNPIVRNTCSFLKYSHSIMNLFRRNGTKAMEKMVNRNQEAVQGLLSAMQKTSRFLHTLSCHTKNNANNQIIQQIPNVRSTMEKLVIEIKSILANNEALKSFWLVSLKNKDIHGTELLSQFTADDSDNQEGEDLIDDQIDDLDSPENSSNEEENEPEISNEEERPSTSRVSSSSSKVFD